MNKETQQIDGYWVIGSNKWNASIYTQEQAEKYSKTLINCQNCINCSSCRSCSYCSSCRDCRSCSYCSSCRSCSYCSSCSDCIDCSSCSDCSDCIDCSYCRSCSSCRDCSYCSSCSDCIDCSYCSDCSSCSDCSDCSSCSDFKTNPQRITSSFLGSRNSQTTYYWDDKREQIICGCFKGTLEELEEQVKITHGDNDFSKGYFKWIELVKMYRRGQL
jgi:hypothetical protein